MIRDNGKLRYVPPENLPLGGRVSPEDIAREFERLAVARPRDSANTIAGLISETLEVSSSTIQRYVRIARRQKPYQVMEWARCLAYHGVQS